MLSAHQESTEDRFMVLSDQHRRLAHQLARGVSDREIADAVPTQIADVYDKVRELMRALKIPGYDYDERRLATVMLCQEFFHVKSSGVSQPSVPQSPPEEVERSEPEERAVSHAGTSEVAHTEGRKSIELPPVEYMAARIKALPQKKRLRLEKVIGARRGELSSIAREFGIDQGSLSVSMGNIYKHLGVTGHPEHKAYLARVLAHIKAEARTTQQASHSASTPIPATLPAEPPAHDQAPQRDFDAEPEVERAPVPSMLAHHGKPNGFGGGVVIPVPPDVTNVDILSGEFRGREASKEFAEGFRHKRAQGLRPAYVVLYPSGDDPSITRANVVFMERGNESK